MNQTAAQKINAFWDFLNRDQKRKTIRMMKMGYDIGAMVAGGYKLTADEFNTALKLKIHEVEGKIL